MKIKSLKIVATLLLSLILIYCNFRFDIDVAYVVFSIVIIVISSLFAPGWFYSIIIFSCLICVLVEMHIFRVYGFPLSKISEQFFNVTLDTNFGEFISYLSLISRREIFFSVLICFITIFFIHSKPIIQSPKNNFFVFLIVPFLLFGIPNSYVHQYKLFKSQSSENSKLIYAHNNFSWGAKMIKEGREPKNVIVLIGESHRYDYFTKYWKKKTQFPNMLYFEDMISQFGYTLKAMPQILSRKTVNDNTSLFYESSLLKLYEEAGYSTHFISYLPKIWKGDDSINFISVESQNYYTYGLLDQAEIIYDDFINDEDAIPILKSILNNDKKNFIVIKLIGVHYNFQDRYPIEFDLLTPSLKNNSLPPELEYKSIYLNTYENAVNYSCSIIYKFFETIKNTSDSSLIFFCSDHGINIFDNDKWNIASTKNAFHIPFIVYGNQKFIDNVEKKNWDNFKAKLKSPLITNDIFESIVSLSGITINNKKNRDLTSDITINEPRVVVFSDKTVHLYEDL